MTKIINTTPHSITLRCSEGTCVINTVDDESIVSLFRGKTSPVEYKNSLEVDVDVVGSIKVTGIPKYSIDEMEFNKLIKDQDEPTVYLISTISAETLKKSSISFPKNVFFMVPYSGPDKEKCYRENGQIKWVAELMDYTE